MDESTTIALEAVGRANALPPRVKIGSAELARNTGLNLVGQLLPVAAGIALMPYIVRGLGPDRFGVLGIVWVVFNYFALFDVGLGRATTKFLAEALTTGRMSEVPGLVWTSLAIQTIFGLVGGGILAAFAPVLARNILKVPSGLVRETEITLWIMGASLPIVLITNGLRSVLEGCQRFDLSNLVKVPASALVFIVPAAVLPFGVHLPGMVSLLWVSRVMVALANLALCMKVLPGLWNGFRFERRLLPTLLKFGGWVTVGNTINGALVSLERFLVGALLSVAAVGFYTAPVEAVTKLLLIPTSLAAAIFPASSALGIDRKRELSKLYSRSIKYLLVGLGPIAIVLCVFSREIIRLWLGTDFASRSTTVLSILAVGVFINCFAHIPYSFLHGLGRPDSAAKLFLLELPVYTFLAVWMIRRWGISGAAVAWSVRVGIELALLFLIVWKLFGLAPNEMGDHGMRKGVFALLGLAALMTLTRTAFAGSLFLQAILGAVWLGLYARLAWSSIFDGADRSSLMAMITPARASVRE